MLVKCSVFPLRQGIRGFLIALFSVLICKGNSSDPFHQLKIRADLDPIQTRYSCPVVRHGHYSFEQSFLPVPKQNLGTVSGKLYNVQGYYSATFPWDGTGLNRILIFPHASLRHKMAGAELTKANTVVLWVPRIFSDHARLSSLNRDLAFNNLR